MKKLFTILLTCTIIISTLIISAQAANEDISPILHTKIFSPEISKGICTADVMITADETYNEEDKCLILAAYDKNDTLTGMSSMEIDINLDNFGYLKKSFSFSADKTTKKVKCFLWESSDSMEPCADVSTVAISDGEEFKPYVLDSIKTVDMMGDNNRDYYLYVRPYYSIGDRNIYYADRDSVIRKVNIDTGNETVLLDLNEEIQRLSDEDDPSSDEDNIYMEGGTLKQVFYDKYQHGLILTVYLEQPQRYYYFTVNNGCLEKILKENEREDRFVASLPNNRLIADKYIYDATNGIQISRSNIPGCCGAVLYRDNKLYCDTQGAVYVTDFINYDKIDNVSGFNSAFNGDYIYTRDIYASAGLEIIKKYTLSGAEKAGIKSTDIAVRDGISGLEGQFMFTDQGEMIIFNGTTFRILKKNL